MTAMQIQQGYRDRLEYHGGTTVERIRQAGQRVLWREWIEFDTVEDALDYFNDAAVCQC